MFSSQFVIWLLPFLLLLRGRVGALVGLLFLLCLVLTRYVYADQGLSELELRPSLLLILRNVVFLALFGLLFWSLRRSGSDSSAAADREGRSE